MWKSSAFDRISTDALALQAHVERAGCAMACAYSSSDEFEAAVIRAKRDAGAYGPKRRRRLVLYAGAATAVLAVVVLLF
jgi:hypothetical protein